MDSKGAVAAYRGFRKQILYTLSRILESSNYSSLTFKPEGSEDLGICNENGKLTESVQVKAHSENLNISSFDPKNPNSFFHRAVQITKQWPDVTIKIISFGPIGQEMLKAWESEGIERQSVTHKFLKYGFSHDDIDIFLKSIKLIKVDEHNLEKKVFSFLKESPAVNDTDAAFDLLHFWLYKAAENRKELKYDDLTSKINNIGRYLSERANYHKEWFASIVPLQDSVIQDERIEELGKEFYQGIAARYEHILAETDVIRKDKLNAIEAAFDKTRVVIIHGASGQGKSTLAFRYLHDFVPENLRFAVRLIENRTHALRIARALEGYAKAINTPMVIFVDVTFMDRDWPDLIRELAHFSGLRILVTIREEDYRRENIYSTDFKFTPIELIFDEEEAGKMYRQLALHKIPDKFLSFESAWKKFGLSGPLLEFVYLITQNESLKDRLAKQVKNIEDKVREKQLNKNELELVRLVSVASSYESRIDLVKLVNYLKLESPQRTIDLFEKEYLLRCSKDGRHIEGLHPIRSELLVELLTDAALAPWITVARSCLPMIVEGDLEVFLFYLFSRRKIDALKLWENIIYLRLKTWTGVAGVLRASLWLGVSQYVEANSEIIHETFERFCSGWFLILDFDIAGVSSGKLESLFLNLDSIPEESKEAIKNLKKRQTPKEDVFIYAKEWLQSFGKNYISPASLSDWVGFGQICFWVGKLNLEIPVLSFFSGSDMEKAIKALPLSSLADVVFGISYALKDNFDEWFAKYKDQVMKKFMKENKVFAIEDDGDTLRAHFIVKLDSFLTLNEKAEFKTDSDRFNLHDETMKRVENLRKLLPHRNKYACQGYGHNLKGLELPNDDTEKTGIPANSMHPSWATNINALFRKIGNYYFRKDTWLEYVEDVLYFRKKIVESLKELQPILNDHFHKNRPIKLNESAFNPSNWDACRNLLRKTFLLPKCEIDEWGFADEGNVAKENEGQEMKQRPRSGLMETGKSQERIETAFNLLKYKDYIRSFGNLESSLLNFYD